MYTLKCQPWFQETEIAACDRLSTIRPLGHLRARQGTAITILEIVASASSLVCSRRDTLELTVRRRWLSSPHSYHDSRSGWTVLQTRKRVHLKLRSLRARKGERFFRDMLHHSIPIICQGQDHPSKDSQPSKVQTPQDASRLPAIMGIGWFLNVAIMLSSAQTPGVRIILDVDSFDIDVDLLISILKSLTVDQIQTTRWQQDSTHNEGCEFVVYICKSKLRLPCV
jgi:hypothetical protein